MSDAHDRHACAFEDVFHRWRLASRTLAARHPGSTIHMTMHKLTLTTLAAALIAGSTVRTVSAQGTAAVRAAIDSGNAQYIRGFAAADAGQVAAVYAPDGGRLGDGGHVARGTAAIRADIDQLLHQVGPITVTLTTTGLWVIDDRAYESGR
jgi:hypothetical protein